MSLLDATDCSFCHLLREMCTMPGRLTWKWQKSFAVKRLGWCPAESAHCPCLSGREEQDSALSPQEDALVESTIFCTDAMI